MNQQLIPVIAAYWGCECSYEKEFSVEMLDEDEFYWMPQKEALNASILMYLTSPLGRLSRIQNFKLHLRPLWSITEDGLRELGEAIGEIYTCVDFDETEKALIAGDEVSPVEIITIGKNGALVLGGDDNIKIINHLRAKGFCVDQELVDANLVEWK